MRLPTRCLALAALTAMVVAAGGNAQGQQPHLRRVRVGQPVGAVSGTVKSVDVDKSQIIVLLPGGAAKTQVVQVVKDTTLVRRSAGQVSDLQVGDRIRVSGLPIVIQARQITAGDALTPSPRPRAPTAPRNQASKPDDAGAPRPQLRRPEALATSVVGEIVATKPLTLVLPSGRKVRVQADKKTKISMLRRVSLKDVKPGESILAVGTREGKGALRARSVSLGFESTPSRPARRRPPRVRLKK